jgi:transcriptional regulator with XRE-family HTH domain
VDDQRLGALVRAVRLRRGLRQQDVADAAGVSQSTISLVERGHVRTLSLEVVRRIAAALDIRVELIGRWRGGDAHRLLGRRHSMLAESFACFVAAHEGWTVEPEVSFAIYGERGIIDHLAWNQAAGHLLVVEFKTAFVDVNEMLGTLDRKRRLIRSIAVERGWQPKAVSVWLIVSDTRTNRRHANDHATLLRSKFPLDGRQLRPLLRHPSGPTAGLAFWTGSSPGGARQIGVTRAGGNKAVSRAAGTAASVASQPRRNPNLRSGPDRRL